MEPNNILMEGYFKDKLPINIKNTKTYRKKLVIKFISLLVFIITKSYIIAKYIVEKFEKYEFNPVLGDDKTGTVFDPYVIQDKDGLYKMYVSW